VLYEIAAGFDTQAHANRFLAIYRENGMGVLPFVETYMDIYCSATYILRVAADLFAYSRFAEP
jgi:hypothetical protein